VDKAIEYAEQWNQFCEHGKEILITKGDVKQTSDGTMYLIEPFIRYFCKFTSNNGYINREAGWEGQAMEAFTHYTYHKSGGSLIVCDLQGRYRLDTFKKNRCRFELTDPAVCSRTKKYGPTDLGEKGIESVFANHQCNQFCH
jgi:Alpha-kinase family